MSTLGLVLTRLQQLATSAISTAVESILKKLFVLLGVLTSLKTQFVDLCHNQLSPLVQTLKNIRAWHVQSTTAESSIKQEQKIAQVEVTLLGLQPQTIAPQIPQPAIPAQKTKQRHAERTKLGRFAPKGTGVAQTHTASQSVVDGSKQAKVAAQLRQRATKQSKKGN